MSHVFFRIALDELHESALFQGQNGSKIFQHDIDLLEKRQYRLAGQIVALSIAHDGPGPHFCNEKLYDLMVGDESELATFDLNTLSFDSTEILQEVCSFTHYHPSQRYKKQDWI